MARAASRITAKERNLIKGAVRRVFSRSELRKQVIDNSVVKGYKDTNRPRVSRWSRCAECKKFEPTYKMEVDHLDPVVPLDKPFASMSFDDLFERIWCDLSNLQAVCKECHKLKTKAENKERRRQAKLSKE